MRHQTLSNLADIGLASGTENVAPPEIAGCGVIRKPHHSGFNGQLSPRQRVCQNFILPVSRRSSGIRRDNVFKGKLMMVLRRTSLTRRTHGPYFFPSLCSISALPSRLVKEVEVVSQALSDYVLLASSSLGFLFFAFRDNRLTYWVASYATVLNEKLSRSILSLCK